MNNTEYKQLRKKAFKLVYSKSKNEFRYFSPIEKQPYWTHLMNVHNYLVTWGETDYEVLIASILHDIVEDSDITISYIKGAFGKKVSDIVDICTKKTNQSDQVFYTKILESKIVGAARIKTFDRIDNIITNYAYSDMEKNPLKKQLKIDECVKYFIPIAKKAKLEKQFNSVLSWWQN